MKASSTVFLLLKKRNCSLGNSSKSSRITLPGNFLTASFLAISKDPGGLVAFILACSGVKVAKNRKGFPKKF